MIGRRAVASSLAGLMLMVGLACLATACAPLEQPGGQAASEPDAQATRVAQAQRTHEYPAARAAVETAVGGASSPIRAVRAFANAYINWSASSVVAQLRALAAQSIGQARSAMALAAAQAGHDYELQRGGVANHGTVEAVAPDTGHPTEYIVVTRELTTSTATDAYQGLQPAWHVALATVTQLGRGRWVLRGWQPES